MLRLLKYLTVALMLAAGSLIAPASAGEVNQTFLGGVAIKGYDPVAYFEEGRAVEGSSSFSHDWNGAEWRFASAANRDLFAADPDRYKPQYGGYCAWAVAQGYTADIDPEAFDIHDGKLYLNFNKSVQRRWRADKPALIVEGDANWPDIAARL